MNRSALKKYAPQARLDFIEAVILRARRLGLDPARSVSVEQTGDVLLIGGQPFPASIAKHRATLNRRIEQQGFTSVVEALAYTWFNRLVAIRFMELKGYLSHGYRVLSNPQGQQPEILDHVQHLELQDLDKSEVIRLKTAGNQDEALYREILLAQCHELHRNMPFLFEALDDATELLLPDHLLRTDSPITRLVNEIDECDWEQIEIIGWLYQFYISEKKEQVIGKVVDSEDIPAATQLFTPNWIVQYLVQNSLGRLWLMANPNSALKEKMAYYIDPVEQTSAAQAQLDALIEVRINEDGGVLNPESLTILDPACGSGHILVEAYNLLRDIYLERGYPLREIPRLILRNNLFGLDVDDRAAQMAGFALLMKAREDDRRLFNDEGNPPYLNVMAIQQSAGLPDEEIAQTIVNSGIQIEGGEAFQSGQLFGGGQLETRHSSGISSRDLRELIQLFASGKTFGSLISVPDSLTIKLDRIIDLLTVVRSQGDDLSRSYANQVLEHFAFPASLLALKYDAVVANPPYMGGKYLNDALRVFSKKEYNSTKSDLFAMFIARGFTWCKSSGFNSMVTMQSWMFLSSYEKFREHVIDSNTLNSLVHLPYDGKGPTAMGINFGLGVFSFYGSHVRGYKSSFDCFRYFELLDNGCPKSFPSNNERSVKAVPDEFKKIPGSPLAYWVPESVRVAYEKSFPISNYAEAKQGLATADNNRFLRQWYEIEFGKIGFDFSSLNDAVCSERKFFPYNKGGEFRKWYGNQLYVVNWKDNGYEIRNFSDGNGKIRSRPQNTQCYFRSSVSWSDITSGAASFRYFPKGFIYDITGMSAQSDNEDTLLRVLAYCNTKLIQWVTKTTNPTMHFQIGNYSSLPVIEEAFDSIDIDLVREAVAIAKEDCEFHEVSWGFKINPLVGSLYSAKTIESAWIGWAEKLRSAVDRVRKIEEDNNQRVINAFGLDGEIDFRVSDEEVTLTVANRESDCISLVSYAIGCMVGRYSLDEVGITYAHSGGSDFDFSRYARFPADADGIIPITEEAWFEDDGAARVQDFVEVVWGAATLPENLEWLANSLGRKSGESASEAIRRYLSVNFFKDHVQAYKKRPIYWLFSSGKQKAFECLVYLHRYNEGTLSRMRMEYVVPLQSRMQARIDKLAGDISSATGSAQQKSLQKRKDKLTKQLEELRRFDETLRPYADQRIALDLDDGVRVNYGKFGDLLAEVKAITGGKED